MKRHIQRQHILQVPYITAATRLILTVLFRDRLQLPLLAVSSLKLQAPQLERHEPISHLDNMHQTVKVIRRQDEEVPTGNVSPPAQHYIPGKGVLQHRGQVLVENGVEILRVSRGCLKLRLQTGIRVVQALSPVALLPELDRPHVRQQKHG